MSDERQCRTSCLSCAFSLSSNQTDQLRSQAHNSGQRRKPFGLKERRFFFFFLYCRGPSLKTHPGHHHNNKKEQRIRTEKSLRFKVFMLIYTAEKLHPENGCSCNVFTQRNGQTDPQSIHNPKLYEQPHNIESCMLYKAIDEIFDMERTTCITIECLYQCV